MKLKSLIKFIVCDIHDSEARTCTEIMIFLFWINKNIIKNLPFKKLLRLPFHSPYLLHATDTKWKAKSMENPWLAFKGTMLSMFYNIFMGTISKGYVQMYRVMTQKYYVRTFTSLIWSKFLSSIHCCCIYLMFFIQSHSNTHMNASFLLLWKTVNAQRWCWWR